MRKRRYFSAYHRGDLKGCLETEQSISRELFYRLIKAHIYRFYAYDERICANRYILYDVVNNVGMPTWLHEYVLTRSKRQYHFDDGVHQ